MASGALRRGRGYRLGFIRRKLVDRGDAVGADKLPDVMPEETSRITNSLELCKLARWPRLRSES
jgi:hypothetical protein